MAHRRVIEPVVVDEAAQVRALIKPVVFVDPKDVEHHRRTGDPSVCFLGRPHWWKGDDGP